MRRSIETGLTLHHETLRNILANLYRKSWVEINTKEFDSITLDEAFKNIFILLFIGTITSYLVFISEILHLILFSEKIFKTNKFSRILIFQKAIDKIQL